MSLTVATTQATIPVWSYYNTAHTITGLLRLKHRQTVTKQENSLRQISTYFTFYRIVLQDNYGQAPQPFLTIPSIQGT